MTEPTINTIEELLVAGSLDKVEAKTRAPLVLEDFNWIGFETLTINGRPCQFMEEHLGSQIWIPEYHFGNTGFSIDLAEQADVIKTEWFGGTGLDRGHLQQFSKVSLVARNLIPHLWQTPGKLRHSLRDPAQHLNTVEEIWWLDRWINPQAIRSSIKLRKDSDKDVDWVFTLGNGSIVVNLEVKRLVGDCMRHVRGRSLKIDPFDRFCQENVIPKFRASDEKEVNVLAISLFGEIDGNVQRVVGDWIAYRQDVIDAVIITSREARRSRCFDWHLKNEKAQNLRQFLREPTQEDQSLVFSLIVPIDIPGIPKMIR